MFSEIFSSILRFPLSLTYFLIFLSMIFMGEEALLIIGAASRLGYIDFWDAFFIALLGVFLGDFFWFKVGAKYGQDFVLKYGRWFFMTPKRFERLEQIIKRNSGAFLFLSKFIYNLNHISLVAAGAVKFNFKKWVKLQILTSLVWTFSFIWLGYFFAHNLAKLKQDVKLFTIVLLFVFVGFLLVEKLIEKIVEKKVIKIDNGQGN